MFIDEQWIQIEERYSHPKHYNFEFNFNFKMYDEFNKNFEKELNKIGANSAVKVHDGGELYSNYHYTFISRGIHVCDEQEIIDKIIKLIKKYEIKDLDD